MMPPPHKIRRAAIACGGTGGHLFPGLAVADELLERGCRVTLLISPKEVDQQAVKGVTGVEVVTLPAVGLVRGGALAFLRGFRDGYRRARMEFRQLPPQAALAMGGFTSAPPILAARRIGARTFLHESNTVPGRANRWLSWIVDCAFVGFPSTAAQLHSRGTKVTGTPVRRQLSAQDAGTCRAALGLDPTRQVILVMGGSQGASAINQLVMDLLPLAVQAAPNWQWFHLCGDADLARVTSAYAASGATAVVQSFCTQMHLALSAATAAISRAGASSLAELAEFQVPAVLIPYPAATDNHQHHNARAFEESGAAILLPQKSATPQGLMEALRVLLQDPVQRERMQQALARLRKPQAAQIIAEALLEAIERRQARAMKKGGTAWEIQSTTSHSSVTGPEVFGGSNDAGAFCGLKSARRPSTKA
jgi:UDP-N-acetylglucosamine--N-acetylmuramyl-(pentapeptide) pyrophosphoryl-undecaprenol N-acetylglucosamine transferase